MSAPVTEEKQHQETPTNPPAHSDNPPSFEAATGVSSADANTVTSPPPAGLAPARDLPPGTVEPEGQAPATSNPNNTYGYVASPPGGMHHHPTANHETGPYMVVPLSRLTETPAMIDCPFCHRRAMTKTNKEGTPMQILAGAVLCIFCICLACVPCLAGWCEDTHIHCSLCGKKVATIPHDGTIQVHDTEMNSHVPSQYAAQVPSQYPAQDPPQYPTQGPPQQHSQGPPPAEHEQPQSPPAAAAKA